MNCCSTRALADYISAASGLSVTTTPEKDRTCRRKLIFHLLLAFCFVLFLLVFSSHSVNWNKNSVTNTVILFLLWRASCVLTSDGNSSCQVSLVILENLKNRNSWSNDVVVSFTKLAFQELVLSLVLWPVQCDRNMGLREESSVFLRVPGLHLGHSSAPRSPSCASWAGRVLPSDSIQSAQAVDVARATGRSSPFPFDFGLWVVISCPLFPTVCAVLKSW